MTSLLVGFDSAWTPTNSGALVGVLCAGDGTFQELGLPQSADFSEAEEVISAWQQERQPATTLIAIDQPSIVKEAKGKSRPVEKIVWSAVARRCGAMQPANTGRAEMLGPGAPIWGFLARFGGPADPFGSWVGTRVFDTYPALAIMAFGWTLADERRPTGRLPKYNPERKTFCRDAWRHVCRRTAGELAPRGLPDLVGWLERAGELDRPHKRDQDQLDACICLLVAIHLAERRECLVVGDMATGYIVVPSETGLVAELEARCVRIGRSPAAWVYSGALNGGLLSTAPCPSVS